jgi:hypothetical protein
MEISRLAAFRRSLPAARTRRGIFAVLGGGLLAAGPLTLGGDEVLSRKRGKRKKRRKNQRKNQQDKQHAQVRIDVTCPGSEVTFRGSSSGDDRMAQTFTATASGPLVKAQLLIGKDPGTMGDFVARLQPVNDAGSPVEEVLAEATVANAAVPEDGFVDFAFAPPFSVVAGVAYALVLTRPGGDRFFWSTEAGSCGGRSFLAFGQTAPFERIGGDSHHALTTFVKS